MKLIKATFAASLVLLSSSAIAWNMPWDDNDHRDRGRWNSGHGHDSGFDMFDDVWGDMFGDMFGDFDFEITMRANAEGWGRGKGRGNNYWRGDHRYRGDQRFYGDNRYYGGRHGPYRPYYGPYRQPGVYGAPPPLTPYGVATRPRPPVAAPRQTPANRAPSYRAAPSRAPGTRAPRTSATTAANVSAQKAPPATRQAPQQPPWATKAPAQTRP